MREGTSPKLILCYAEQPGKETTGTSIGFPSPLSAIEIALKRLDRFERLELPCRGKNRGNPAMKEIEHAAR
jgi:hypothetical protein